MPTFFFVFCIQLEFVIRPIAVGDLSEAAEEESHNRPILPNELGEELSDKEPWHLWMWLMYWLMVTW